MLASASPSWGCHALQRRRRPSSVGQRRVPRRRQGSAAAVVGAAAGGRGLQEDDEDEDEDGEDEGDAESAFLSFIERNPLPARAWGDGDSARRVEAAALDPRGASRVVRFTWEDTEEVVRELEAEDADAASLEARYGIPRAASALRANFKASSLVRLDADVLPAEHVVLELTPPAVQGLEYEDLLGWPGGQDWAGLNAGGATTPQVAQDSQRRAEAARAGYLRRVRGDPGMATIVLVQAGHAAVGVWSGAAGKLVLSKTFSTYMVRKKQGGSQLNTEKGGTVGARLRARNARAFLQNVAGQLATWEDAVGRSRRIFVACPPPLWGALHKCKRPAMPFAPEDVRTTRIRFQTGTPKLEELRRVAVLLSTGTIVHR